jgi:hypothetical protein
MEKKIKKVTESTKRAKLLEDSACEMLRAWWNWLYWAYGGDGPLSATLSPTRYAWDETGRRETVDTCKLVFALQCRQRWASFLQEKFKRNFYFSWWFISSDGAETHIDDVYAYRLVNSVNFFFVNFFF